MSAVCPYLLGSMLRADCLRLPSLRSLHPDTPYYFSLRWVAGRSFPFSKALLHGAVGYKVFPINTLAAKREEDLSGNGVAA